MIVSYEANELINSILKLILILQVSFGDMIACDNENVSPFFIPSLPHCGYFSPVWIFDVDIRQA